MTSPERTLTDEPSTGPMPLRPAQPEAIADGDTGRAGVPAEHATFVCDFDGTITHGNESFAALFCTGSQQPAGMSLRDCLLADHSDETVATVLGPLRDGTPVCREMTLSTTTTDRQFVVQAQPIVHDGVELIFGSCIDITARRRTERTQRLFAEVSRLIGAADTYRDALDGTLSAICTYTEWAYGEVWTPQPEAGELTYTLGHTDDPELEPFHAESTSTTFAFGAGLPGRVYESGSPEWIPDVSAEPADVFHRTALASTVGVRAALGVPVIADDSVVAVMAFFLRERRAIDDSLAADISQVATRLGALVDRRQTEREVRRRNERLEEFASVVSHDLRNPLNVASGTLDMVREERDSDRLATVAAAHERMATLIEDVLTLARQGKAVESMAAVRLDSLAADCWQTVDTADATLTVATDRRLRADRSRLRQIVENLFRNSVEHGSTSSRPQADDAVDHAGSGVTVTVGDLDTGFYIEDDGPGIDPADREQVFDPGHTTTTEGNGLGLSIVRETVEAHGWQVSVTEGTDGGARFEITNVEWCE